MLLYLFVIYGLYEQHISSYYVFFLEDIFLYNKYKPYYSRAYVYEQHIITHGQSLGREIGRGRSEAGGEWRI